MKLSEIKQYVYGELSLKELRTLNQKEFQRYYRSLHKSPGIRTINCREDCSFCLDNVNLAKILKDYLAQDIEVELFDYLFNVFVMHGAVTFINEEVREVVWDFVDIFEEIEQPVNKLKVEEYIKALQTMDADPLGYPYNTLLREEGWRLALYPEAIPVVGRLQLKTLELPELWCIDYPKPTA